MLSKLLSRWNCYDDDSCAAIGETPYHLGEDIHTTWNRHFDVDPLGRHFLKKLQWDFDAESKKEGKVGMDVRLSPPCYHSVDLAQ